MDRDCNRVLSPQEYVKQQLVRAYGDASCDESPGVGRLIVEGSRCAVELDRLNGAGRRVRHALRRMVRSVPYVGSILVRLMARALAALSRCTISSRCLLWMVSTTLTR